MKQANAWTAPQDSFDGRPTYATDYIKHTIAKPSAIVPNVTLHHSDQPMDNLTNYRQEYIQHDIPEKWTRPQPSIEGNPAPFDSLSTNRRDFGPKQCYPQPSCKPDIKLNNSDEPLQSDTTHRYFVYYNCYNHICNSQFKRILFWSKP